jgi:hypothetical protein
MTADLEFCSSIESTGVKAFSQNRAHFQALLLHSHRYYLPAEESQKRMRKQGASFALLCFVFLVLLSYLHCPNFTTPNRTLADRILVPPVRCYCCTLRGVSIACNERMCVYVGTPGRNDDQDAAEALHEVCERVCVCVFVCSV